MNETFTYALNWLEDYPQLQSLLGVALLLLLAWVGNLVVKRILLRGLYRLLRMNSLGQHAVSTDTSFIARLANIIPALIISTGIALVPNLPDVIVTIVRNVCSAFIVLTIALAIGSLLT